MSIFGYGNVIKMSDNQIAEQMSIDELARFAKVDWKYQVTRRGISLEVLGKMLQEKVKEGAPS